MHRIYLITSALIFAAVAILHLLRLINDWNFLLGPWSIPRWVSWASAVFPACLSAWALSLAMRRWFPYCDRNEVPRMGWRLCSYLNRSE